MTAGAKLAAKAKPTVNVLWRKQYTETVSQYGFDVKVTDSLVTPYTGVLSYDEVVWLTAEHPTEKEAEQDNSFTSSLKNSHVHLRISRRKVGVVEIALCCGGCRR